MSQPNTNPYQPQNFARDPRIQETLRFRNGRGWADTTDLGGVVKVLAADQPPTH